jgi:hypothetical protein
MKNIINSQTEFRLLNEKTNHNSDDLTIIITIKLRDFVDSFFVLYRGSAGLFYCLQLYLRVLAGRRKINRLHQTRGYMGRSQRDSAPESDYV